MNNSKAVLTAEVPVRRLRRAEKILDKLGLSPAEAVSMLLAQIEIRKGLPFDVAITPNPLITADEQATAWTKSFGAY